MRATPSAQLLALALCFHTLHAADYYLSPTGADTNPGSALSPWKSINTALSRAAAGDALHLQAGAIFVETIDIKPGVGSAGTQASPIRLTSDPLNRAIIQPPNTSAMALYIYNAAGLVFEHLRFIGPGMDIHQSDGLGAYADNGHYIGLTFRSCEVTGFGGTGLWIGGWNAATYGFGNVLIEDCELHANRKNGCDTWGQSAAANTNVVFRRCKAYDNLGDPAATHHSGSGIIMGSITDGLMEHCIAYNNGARSVTTGGPVGLWTYDSTRVTIQFCEAYQNHAVNCDGGGFDIDGGAQDCIIQYCYSHDNDGPGYLICQYSGARAYTNNVVRYNISQNDSRKNGFGGLHFYSAGSSGGLQTTKIYGNVIYNECSHVVRFQNTSGQTGTKLWNNIFISKNNKLLLAGSPSTTVAQFQNNAWWSSGGTFSVAGYTSLSAWRTATGQELLNANAVGLQADPLLVSAGGGGIVGDTTQLNTLSAYKLQSTSPAINAGLNLPALFAVNPGSRDFYGNALPQSLAYDIGAHEFAATVPAAPTALTATPGNAQVALSWTAVSGASSYTLKRATTSGGPYANIATGLTTPSYVNTGLSNGTTYHYVVSASNASGQSPNSTQASATPIAPPAAPTGLTASAGNAQVSLTWTAANGASSYTLKRATTSGGPYTNIATGLATPSYVNTGLSNGTTYYYVVSASNVSGQSPNSTQVSATPRVPAVAPQITTQPANVTVNAGQSASFSVVATGTPAPTYQWQKNGNTIAGATSASYTISAVQSPDAGSYRVTVSNSAGTRVSNSATLTVNTPAIQAPYGGQAWRIPGTILSENYDTGGEGVAYHDSDTVNTGAAYRSDGVDVAGSTANYVIGWIKAGEWLEYTVNVAAAGTYNLGIAVASPAAGATLHVEFNGVNKSGTIVVPNTGSWYSYQLVTVNSLTLNAGNQVLRIAFDSNSSTGYACNLDYFNFNAAPVIVSSATAVPNSGYVGQNIAFSVAASDPEGGVLGYSWSFGDGSSANGESAAHAYAAAGTYTAVVSVADGSGGTAHSSVAVTILPAPVPQAINCGGSATGNYSADVGYSAGRTYTTSAAIDVSGVSNPAARGVYQTTRYGNFTYTVANLTAEAPYTVRLHFAEIYWSAAGRRLFNVSINQQSVLSNFDIFATAGARYKALVREFSATADINGLIAVAFVTLKDNANINGIEVVPNDASSASAHSAAPEAVAAAAQAPGNDSIDLSTVKLNQSFRLCPASVEIGETRPRCC